MTHITQNRGGPFSYYLRIFQFFLRQRGLTQAHEPDLLTPPAGRYAHFNGLPGQSLLSSLLVG